MDRRPRKARELPADGDRGLDAVDPPASCTSIRYRARPLLQAEGRSAPSPVSQSCTTLTVPASRVLQRLPQTGIVLDDQGSSIARILGQGPGARVPGTGTALAYSGGQYAKPDLPPTSQSPIANPNSQPQHIPIPLLPQALGARESGLRRSGSAGRVGLLWSGGERNVRPGGLTVKAKRIRHLTLLRAETRN